MRVLNEAEHEALCRRCGISCHFALPVNGVPMVIDELRCKFLGRDPDCPYPRDVPGYRGKVRPSADFLGKILPAVRAEVARVGVPFGACPDSAQRLLEGDGSRWRYSLREDGQGYVFERLSSG